MRIAIYARYSDDLQSPHSIDDQVRLCRDHALRLALGEVVEVYGDAALSGAAMQSRPELRRLLADCRRGRFDAVLIESLDRISRDQEDIAHIRKHIVFSGAKLLAVDDGEVTELHVGLKGTMNALFLKDLGRKVRRGQAGRALAGSSPGGLSYGYNVVHELDPNGELVRGKRVIKEDQAAVIRRIFAEYGAGQSPRAIAIALNREGIPSPRGKHWNPSSVAGQRGRASGILWNELYIGRLVYNRTRFLRDPETGKRLSRPNPPEEWVTASVPGLRIVDDAAWEAAQARHALYAGRPLNTCHRPRHAFSGLLRCACCGATYTMRDRGRVGCSGRHDRGTCDNHTTVAVAEIEARVLAGLKSRLLQPDLVAAYVEEYHAECERLRQAERRRRAGRESRHTAILGQLDRLIDQVGKGYISGERVTTRIAELEAERIAIAADLRTALEPDVVTLHPKTITRYRARIEDLGAALTGPPSEARSAAIQIVREFIERIEIGPPPTHGAPPAITAHGLLPRVLHYAAAPRPAMAAAGFSVVAGEGFEPPTLGL